MNKLLSNGLFYGSAIIIGGSLGALVGASNIFHQSSANEEIESIEAQIEEVKEEKKELAKDQETKAEEKPAKNNEKSLEKSAVSEPKTVSKTETVKPKTSTPKVTVPTTETITYTYYDYEITILGTCPHERDKSNSWEEGNRLNAIGIITSGEGKTSPINSLKSYIETWWNGYKLGRWTGKHMMASLNNMVEFDNTYANSSVGMFIDFDGFFVNWDNSWENGQSINVSDAQAQTLNQMASDGTLYLRWLENTYNAKCPND